MSAYLLCAKKNSTRLGNFVDTLFVVILEYLSLRICAVFLDKDAASCVKLIGITIVITKASLNEILGSKNVINKLST